MSAEPRWDRVKQVFQDALDRKPDERSAFVREACGDDRGLRAEVDSLLLAHEEAGSFAQRPAIDALSASAADVDPEVELHSLSLGTIFGPYRILRLLGRGGMGIVYEAEEVDSARRVALKVIATTLRDRGERDRFLREGRLAASINHPNCVYVFGAYEIDGHPVIALEPMLETLADRLHRDGPLPPAAAVDAILQIARGLAAAAEGGILHRDVKPSNCFVGEHGLVKIGDFGISRSARPAIDTTQLSTIGHVVGTPTYASPEQLRGSPLDTRSDIYSVGATLFELLTGRPPFAAADLVSVVMAVANDPPPAPYTFNRTIPKGLSAVVVRCLAKKPEQRFADYQQLAEALEPFASTTPTAATLGRRFLAGTIDLAIVSTPLMALSMGQLIADGTDSAALRIPGTRLAEFVTMLLYFSFFESIWGATPGKALCGLVVISASGQRASPILVMTRAAVYAMWLLLIWFVFTWNSSGLDHTLGGPLAFWTVSAFALMPLAILFSTARRHNGFAGLHDLGTRTRVVERRVRAVQAGLTTSVAPPPHVIVGRAGPYEVLADPVGRMGDRWRWGFDPRLRRAVWLRFSDHGTPPVVPARRAVSRGTRLRWLAGRRLDNEAWDAYEAVEGVPLLEATRDRHEWTDVRWWLLDLASECAAMTTADRAPRSPQRVWALASGGVKWIDDPVADAVAPADSVATDQQLLIAIARTALGGELVPVTATSLSRHPLPLGACRFLEHLDSPPDRDIGGIVRELEALTKQGAVLTRAWRLVPVAICALVPAFALSVAVAISTTRDVRRSRVPIDDRTAGALLWQLALADRAWLALSVDERESIERALATRYRDVLSEGQLFTPRNMDNLNLHDYHRAIASDILRRYPQPLPDRRDQVDARAAAIIRRVTRQDAPPRWYRPILSGAFPMYLSVAVLAAVVNFAFRRGLIRMMGLELVTADGRPASRLRVLARTAITWSPVLLVPFVMPFVPQLPSGLTGAPWWMLGMAAGAVVIAISPGRGVQDRIAGTWVVPR
jgi:serine/threonine protein kinase